MLVLQQTSSSSSSCLRLLCSLVSSQHRSIWTATAAAAEVREPAASTAQDGSASPPPSSSQEAAVSSTSEPHALDGQQQQPAAAIQQQQQLRQLQGSLHEQVLYQMPADGQPLPPLPRFRSRRPEQRPMPILQALALLKKSSPQQHTVEAHLRLKVDPRRGDHMVRGAAVLPHSWQKGLRIAVFAEGEAADEARAAGADVVGSADLITSILDSKGKAINFTACIATPDMMPQLVKLGRILGPKGLMPNPKMGTLTDNVASAIAELRQGRVEFKMDKTGIVHVPIGKAYFEEQALYLNIGALAGALLAAKPEAIKGGLPKFVRTAYLASTMGVSVPVDVVSLGDAVGAAAAAKSQKKADVARA